MDMKSMGKKIELLEDVLTLNAKVYYNVNLTADTVQGKIYENVNGTKYCVNGIAGFPEKPSFSDVISYWGEKVLQEERKAYFDFFNVPVLLDRYKNGEEHLYMIYHMELILSKTMTAEHHISMYKDEETGDVLAIGYIREITSMEKMQDEMDVKQQYLDTLCREYTAVYSVNLMKDRIEPLKVELSANASKLSRIKLHEGIAYTETIQSYCKNFVSDKDKEEFLHVLDREYLIARMQEKEQFRWWYESVPNEAGYHHFEMQIVRINKENFDGNAIMAFRYVDDTVAREKKEQQRLELLAYSDALTGLGNRMAFRKAISQFDVYGNAACIVADVNNLKLCNDRYGHQEGDKIIIDAADCIRMAFDGFGTCYRIGGDEFCVLIPEGKKEKLLEALDSVHLLIEEKNKYRAMNLSVAFGYAFRDSNSETTEHLFNRSDEMMYDVKYKMKKTFLVYREERIGNYLNVLEILTKSTDDYLFLWDIGKDELWFFDDVQQDYELENDGKPTIAVKDLEKAIYPADWQMLYDDLLKIAMGIKPEHNLNYRWTDRSGEVVWVNCRGRAILDDKGKPFCMIGRVSDQLLRHMYHPLTKLFNREKMFLDLKENPYSYGYFMLVAIDRLGDINLKYGRHFGDKVIKRCAKAVEEFRSAEYVWHVENNSFAMYLDVETEEEVRHVYEELGKHVEDVCTLSAGVVPNNYKIFGDEHNLYECAELTLDKAKQNGMSTIMFFSPEDLEERKRSIQILEELQRSVKNGFEGFYLCYQPQVRIGNYQMYGAEALLRFQSKLRGTVYPDEFIPLLEQSKLINPVGRWVLEQALLHCKMWRTTMPEFRISVNFSAMQLREKDVAEKVLDILEKVKMPGDSLTIEITESAQILENQELRNIFRKWKEAGIGLSIDDFGTGYSSMSYLKELEVEEIKIDRQFISGIEEATYNYRLISNMIEFARNSNIRICCEGVEDVQELAVLEGLSPNLIQGYLFSKPCEEEKFQNAFIDSKTAEYIEYQSFIHKIYQYKNKMHVVYFDAKDILRETDMGLWIIRINEEDTFFEMYADETMERVLAVDRKYTPQECYRFWHDRIREDSVSYVNENVKHMIESGNVVQLQYPWNHPMLGEVVVRCSGKRAEDADGMVVLKGYHRIISTIEETEF